MDLAGLTSDVTEAMAVRYASVATVALWVYDYFLTFEDEVQLVWPARLTVIKALFLANRYLPLLVTCADAYFIILNDNKQAQICRPAFIAIGFASFAGFFLAEAVLAIRAYVIWETRTIIGVLVGCLFLTKTIAAAVITYIFLNSTTVPPVTLFQSGCEVIFTKRYEWITIFGVFLFEVVILTLMMMAKRSHLRGSTSEIVAVLVQDGILYCICIMVISLINVMIVKFAPPILSPFLVVTQGTLHNILCTRLLLRLRGANSRRRSVQCDSNNMPLLVTISTDRTVSSR